MFNSSNGYSLADIAAATRTGSGDGFFGDSGWWIILLFLFALGGWGNGGFAGANAAAPIMMGASMDSEAIRDLTASTANGFYDLNTGVLTGLANVNAGVAAGTAAIQHDLCGLTLAGCQNTDAILQAINGNTVGGMQNTFTLAQQLNNMQSAQQLANCQTDSKISSALAQLDYNIATENCSDRQAVADGVRNIIETSNNNTRSILDFLVQDRIAALQSENAALRSQASQAEQSAYLISQLRPSPVPAYTVSNPYSSCSCGNYSYGSLIG